MIMRGVKTALSVRLALLLALRQGPGYGQELVDRVSRLSGGGLRIPLPHAYLALKHLHRRGLVRRWEVVPGGARGARRRVYHGLSARGVAAAATLRGSLLGIAGQRLPESAVERRAMADRLIEGNALNAFGSALQDAMTRTRS